MLEELKNGILAEINKFKAVYLNDSIYGVAIIIGQAGNYVGLAFATEKGLEKIASEYLNKRSSNWEEQRLYTNIENLKSWLKWANPDDGWHYVDFPEVSFIDSYLKEVRNNVFAEAIDTKIEKDWIQVFRDHTFQEMEIVFGVTYGENPDDFLRTATMINTYDKVKQLWVDRFIAMELSC